MIWVYFMQAGEIGPIKIGSSSQPELRVAQIQAQHYETLRIRLKLEMPPHSESHFHAYFEMAHLRGEWFRPVPELLEFIQRPFPLLRNARDVVESLGGRRRAAVAFGVKPSAVENWLTAGYIPARFKS